MRNTEKAESEIKNLGFDLKYKISGRVLGKDTFCLSVHSIKEIISFFEKDETLSFLLNHGRRLIETEGKWDPNIAPEFSYNEDYDESIYWEHDHYGDCVRVSSDKGGIDRFVKRMPLIERMKKIKKIKNKIT